MDKLPYNVVNNIVHQIHKIHKKHHIEKFKHVLDEYKTKVKMGNTCIEFGDDHYEFNWRRMNDAYIKSNIHNMFQPGEFQGIGKVVGKVPLRYVYSNGF